MESNARIVLVEGTPGDGKSTLTAYLAHVRRARYSYGFIISTTLYNDSIWSKIGWLYQVEISESSQKQISELLAKQKQVIVRCTKHRRPLPRTALILDDLLGTTRFQDKDMIQLLTTSRHLHIDVYITSQYTRAVSPLLRGLATDVYFSRQSEEGLKKLIDAYLAFLPKSEQFEIIRSLHNAGRFVFVHYSRIKNIYRLVKVPN